MILQTKTDKKTLTSLEVCEQINLFRQKESELSDKPYKELAHYDLLKIIRSEFDEERGEGKISCSSYMSIQNKELPMYVLPLSETKQILLRESKFVRKAVIHYIEELEKVVKELTLPQNFAQALRLAAEQQEEIERNKLLLAEKVNTINLLSPKVEAFDTFIETKSNYNMAEASKLLSFRNLNNKRLLGRNNLIKVLKSNHILLNDGTPAQEQIDREYFVLVTKNIKRGANIISTGKLTFPLRTTWHLTWLSRSHLAGLSCRWGWHLHFR